MLILNEMFTDDNNIKSNFKTLYVNLKHVFLRLEFCTIHFKTLYVNLKQWKIKEEITTDNYFKTLYVNLKQKTIQIKVSQDLFQNTIC